MVRAFLPRLVWALYHVLNATIRWREIGNVQAPRGEQRFILCFWHARMLMMPRPFRARHGYMLISEHRDGSLIAETMHLLGIQTVRGSASRSGAKAMLQMLRLVKNERCDLGITPDGPRGPREKVKPGVVQLAKKTGLPILPVCYACKRHWRANSWDRFYVPMPFNQGVFVFGDFLWIKENEDTNEALSRVQQAMDRVQAMADGYFS